MIQSKIYKDTLIIDIFRIFCAGGIAGAGVSGLVCWYANETIEVSVCLAILLLGLYLVFEPR